MPPSAQQINFFEILRTLCRHSVEFIVVGGVSAALQGAPVNTYDIDIVHSREPANVDRLLAALVELDAIHRFQPDRRIRPAALLLTKFGPLDALGMIGNSHTYEDLAATSELMTPEPGMSIRVLDLATQIRIKEEVAGAKDLAVLPILRRTLEERRRSDLNRRS